MDIGIVKMMHETNQALLIADTKRSELASLKIVKIGVFAAKIFKFTNRRTINDSIRRVRKFVSVENVILFC